MNTTGALLIFVILAITSEAHAAMRIICGENRASGVTKSEVALIEKEGSGGDLEFYLNGKKLPENIVYTRGLEDYKYLVDLNPEWADSTQQQFIFTPDPSYTRDFIRKNSRPFEHPLRFNPPYTYV